jgi:Protein of unknown function (DUF3014)
MGILDDYAFRTQAEQPSGHRRRRSRAWLAALGLLPGIVGLVYVYVAYLRERPPAQTARLATDVDMSGPSTRAPAVDEPLPSLDASDALVRELGRRLTSHPELAAWLATDRLVRTFVASVDGIAGGLSPAKRFRGQAPSEAFRAAGSRQSLYIDPRSYSRYDRFADIVGSIDAQGAAAVYRRLKPLMQQAYGELGYVDRDFDEAMRNAMGALLAVPVEEGRVELIVRSVAYEYVDPELESLTPAQKQLFRMGPRNVKIIQNKLGELAKAANLH